MSQPHPEWEFRFELEVMAKRETRVKLNVALLTRTYLAALTLNPTQLHCDKGVSEVRLMLQGGTFHASRLLNSTTQVVGIED